MSTYRSSKAGEAAAEALAEAAVDAVYGALVAATLEEWAGASTDNPVSAEDARGPVDPSKRYTRSYHIFSHPPGRKTLSTRATRRRPHSKPLGRSRCSLDAGERMAHALDGGEAKNTGSGRPLA